MTITTVKVGAMERRVSAAEANRKFSELLRGVRDGDTYVVTAHGRPVAKLVPITQPNVDLMLAELKKRQHLQLLRSQPVTASGRWTREELYERTPWRDGPAEVDDPGQ